MQIIPFSFATYSIFCAVKFSIETIFQWLKNHIEKKNWPFSIIQTVPFNKMTKILPRNQIFLFKKSQHKIQSLQKKQRKNSNKSTAKKNTEVTYHLFRVRLSWDSSICKYLWCRNIFRTIPMWSACWINSIEKFAIEKKSKEILCFQ